MGWVSREHSIGILQGIADIAHTVALGNRDGVVYSVALRVVRYEVTNKGRVVANANRLVGVEHPTQAMN